MEMELRQDNCCRRGGDDDEANGNVGNASAGGNKQRKGFKGALYSIVWSLRNALGGGGIGGGAEAAGRGIRTSVSGTYMSTLMNL